MSEIPQSFMDYVQHHERVWGMEHYPQRPSLAQILEATVVVFWQKLGPENLHNRRYQISLHENIESLEKAYSEMLYSTKFELQSIQIHRIFKQGKRLKIKALKIQFELEELLEDMKDEDLG